MFYLGIDVGKSFHSAALLAPDGATVAALPSFANTARGFRSLASFLRHHLPAGQRLRIGIEATGPYWIPLFRWLAGRFGEVVVLNPLKVASLRSYGVRGSKTDRIDAVLIAQAVRWEETDALPQRPPHAVELRHLTRLRSQFVKDLTRLSLRLISILDVLFPELLPLFSKPICPSTLALLAIAPTPEKALALGEEILTSVLKKASGGKLGRAKAQEILAVARRSVGVPSPALEEALALLLAQVHFLGNQLETLNRRIKSLYSEARATLHTLPGVGPILAATLLGEFGAVDLFHNAPQMVAYAGIDPRLRQSGTYQGQVRMSKRGSPYLRHALYLAAQTAVRNDAWFAAVYQRQRHRGKPHRQALGAVMNRLVHVLYAIWRDNRAYVPLTSS